MKCGTLVRGSWWLILVGLLGGCGHPQPDFRVLWPLPPDQPRLEHLGNYQSKDDLPKDRLKKWFDENLGIAADQVFAEPSGIYAQGAQVYISDPGRKQVVRFDFSRRTVTTLSAGTGFESPLGLDGDSRGNLYVADSVKQSVLVFDSAGHYVANLQGPGWFVRPVDVAVSEPSSRLYVSDAGGHRIVVCDLAGHRLFSFGRQGSAPGEFGDPHGLAFDREGRLYVTDTGNARIQVFEADGRFVRQFGSAGTTVNTLQKPWDVAFDQQGHLYVLDQGLRALLICQPTGQVLLATGSKTPSGGRLGFAEPTGLFIDANDRIFISDRQNKRFAIWQYLNESYLQQHPVSDEDLSRLKQVLEAQQEPPSKSSS